MLLLLEDETIAPVVVTPTGASVLTEVTDHTARALDRLLAQFKGKPRIQTLLGIYVDQVQELEAVLFDLIEERSLVTGAGVQLDNLGTIIGRPRGNLTDAEYRVLLSAQIKVNISDGQPEQLIEIVRLMLGASVATVRVDERYPAQQAIVIQGALDAGTARIVASLLQHAKAAGVRLVLEYSESLAAETFQFTRAVDFPTFDAQTGFDSATLPGTGSGNFAGAV